MPYRGHVRDGVVVLEGPDAPPEGTPVSVRTLRPRTRRGKGEAKSPPTLYDRLHNVIGIVTDLPPDFAANLDHYLYGAPKRR